MQSSFSSKLTAFSPLIVDNLWNKSDNRANECLTGIFSNFSFGWICKNDLLHVFNLKDGSNRAFWHFGNGNKDSETIITCILEVKIKDEGMFLLVGTSNVIDAGGLIHLFNIQTCSVIKCVKIPFEVTALEILGNTNEFNSNFQMHDLISNWSGVIALGTQCGHLYIMDLCLTNNSISSILSPGSLLPININYTQSFNQHHFINLNAVSEQEEKFSYKETYKNLITKLPRSDVFVSCLKYFGNASLLIIGYNFGSFEIWNMEYLILEFSSPYYETSNEINHISFQQPENDPKPICYLWIGCTSTIKNQTLAHIYLYQLIFKTRVNSKCGYIYKDLMNCACRFSSLLNTERSMDRRSSKLISCTAITRPNNSFSTSDISIIDESAMEVTSPLFSLCLIAWSQSVNGDTKYILSIFDLNQWYFAALPSTLNISLFENTTSSNKYWILFDLNEEYKSIIPDYINSIHIDAASISRFCSLPNTTKMQLHMEPSALNFSSYSLSESGIVTSKFLGIPQKTLHDIQRQSHSLVLNPNPIFNSCLQAGLIFYDLPRTLNSSEERNKILSLCLDYNCLSFLISCIRNWSINDHSKEFSIMKELNIWAFNSIKNIKYSVDELLNEFVVNKSKWRHIFSKVNALVIIYEEMLICSKYADENSIIDITYRLKICKLLESHVKFIEFLHNSGAFSDQDVQSLAPLHIEYKSMNRTTLMDNILSNEALQITKVISQNKYGKYYPPNNFKEMLNILPIPDIDMDIKLFFCLYLLKDISHTIKCFNLQDKMYEFKKIFNISNDLINFVYGVWLIDQKQEEKGLEKLNKCDDLDLLTDRFLTEIVNKCLLTQDKNNFLIQLLLKSVYNGKRFTDYSSILRLLIKNDQVTEAYKYCKLYEEDPIPIIIPILKEFFPTSFIKKCYQLCLQNNIDINKYSFFDAHNPDLVLSHNLFQKNCSSKIENPFNSLQFQNCQSKLIYNQISNLYQNQNLDLYNKKKNSYYDKKNKMHMSDAVVPRIKLMNKNELNVDMIKQLFCTPIKMKQSLISNDGSLLQSNKILISCLSTKTKKNINQTYDETVSSVESSQIKLKPKYFRFSEDNDYPSPLNLKKFKINKESHLTEGFEGGEVEEDKNRKSANSKINIDKLDTNLQDKDFNNRNFHINNVLTNNSSLNALDFDLSNNIKINDFNYENNSINLNSQLDDFYDYHHISKDNNDIFIKRDNSVENEFQNTTNNSSGENSYDADYMEQIEAAAVDQSINKESKYQTSQLNRPSLHQFFFNDKSYLKFKDDKWKNSSMMERNLCRDVEREMFSNKSFDIHLISNMVDKSEKSKFIDQEFLCKKYDATDSINNEDILCNEKMHFLNSRMNNSADISLQKQLSDFNVISNDEDITSKNLNVEVCTKKFSNYARTIDTSNTCMTKIDIMASTTNLNIQIDDTNLEISNLLTNKLANQESYSDIHNTPKILTDSLMYTQNNDELILNPHMNQSETEHQDKVLIKLRSGIGKLKTFDNELSRLEISNCATEDTNTITKNLSFETSNNNTNFDNNYTFKVNNDLNITKNKNIEIDKNIQQNSFSDKFDLLHESNNSLVDFSYEESFSVRHKTPKLSQNMSLNYSQGDLSFFNLRNVHSEREQLFDTSAQDRSIFQDTLKSLNYLECNSNSQIDILKQNTDISDELNNKQTILRESYKTPTKSAKKRDSPYSTLTPRRSIRLLAMTLNDNSEKSNITESYSKSVPKESRRNSANFEIDKNIEKVKHALNFDKSLSGRSRRKSMPLKSEYGISFQDFSTDVNKSYNILDKGMLAGEITAHVIRELSSKSTSESSVASENKLNVAFLELAENNLINSIQTETFHHIDVLKKEAIPELTVPENKLKKLSKIKKNLLNNKSHNIKNLDENLNISEIQDEDINKKGFYQSDNNIEELKLRRPNDIGNLTPFQRIVRSKKLSKKQDDLKALDSKVFQFKGEKRRIYKSSSKFDEKEATNEVADIYINQLMEFKFQSPKHAPEYKSFVQKNVSKRIKKDEYVFSPPYTRLRSRIISGDHVEDVIPTKKIKAKTVKKSRSLKK